MSRRIITNLFLLPSSLLGIIIMMQSLPKGNAFVTPLSFQRCCSTSTSGLLLSSSDDNDDDFQKALRDRIQQVSDRATKIPVVVLDTMLPRQVLKIESPVTEVFTNLVKKVLQEENPVFGMIGMARLTTGQDVPLQNGVMVEIVGQPIVMEESGMVRVELRANKRFRIQGELSTAPEGWTVGRVMFLDSAQDEEQEDKGALARAISAAREFTSPNINMGNGKSLIDRWIELARQNEHKPGQIDQLLLDLGDIPLVEQPTELALWVGALINPLPGIGVAMEIRPALLMARTAEERVKVALEGIRASIKHMDGSKRLF